jgi:hypothetical protein
VSSDPRPLAVAAPGARPVITDDGLAYLKVESRAFDAAMAQSLAGAM